MVPSGWKLEFVENIFNVQLGKMLNKVAKEQFPQFQYLGNTNVKWGYFELSDLKSMFFNEREREKFTLLNGDILMCEGGEVGRCAIWILGQKDVFFQKALHRLRSKGSIIPEYFQNYMIFIAGTKLLDDSTTRTSIAHLTREKLLKLPIKVPPLHEQQKIAQILSTWDKAISTTESLIANSQQQKKSLMQQLLTCKKRFAGFKEKWKKVRLGDITEMNSGGTPKSSVTEYYDGNISWVSIADMTKHGKWIFKTDKNISQLGLENSSARLYPVNTVLYAMYASIGECSIAKIELTSSQAILGIRVGKDLNHLYLYYFLSSLKDKIKLLGQQGTQANLNAAMVKDFKFKLPTIEEQKKIASVMTAADQEIETLQQKLTYLKQEKKALMQQLLTGKRRVKVDDETEAA